MRGGEGVQWRGEREDVWNGKDLCQAYPHRTQTAGQTPAHSPTFTCTHMHTHNKHVRTCTHTRAHTSVVLVTCWKISFSFSIILSHATVAF